MKKVPITLRFDITKVIGWLEIEDEYANQFDKLALAPSFKGENKELLEFGLTPIDDYFGGVERYRRSKT